MTDLIKEFNMTDLLGMLVPGSVVAFLVDKEYNILSILAEHTGTVFPTALTITLTIVAGYFIGMLLHEIGDCVEKMLWCFPGFNPRIYAAYATGIKGDSSKSDTKEASKKRLPKIVGQCVIGLLTCVVLLCLVMRTFEVGPDSLWESFVCGLFVAIILAIACYILCWQQREKISLRKLFSVGGINSFFEAAENICKDNTPLSYCVWKVTGDSDEYVKMVLRKRDLFDGFRTAARNLLITFMLFGLHASVSSGLTHDLRELLISSREFIWLVSAVLYLLVLRYYHFSYLRYKYCYEDYGFYKENLNKNCPK